MRTFVGETYRPAEQEYTRPLGQLLIYIRTIQLGCLCEKFLTTKNFVGLLIRNLNAELLLKRLLGSQGRVYWMMVPLRLP